MDQVLSNLPKRSQDLMWDSSFYLGSLGGMRYLIVLPGWLLNRAQLLYGLLILGVCGQFITRLWLEMEELW